MKQNILGGKFKQTPVFLLLERRSKIFFRRLQHGHTEVTRKRPGSVFNSSSGLRHSLISPGHIKTRHFMSSDVMTKGHDELSFTTVTSERNTESVIIQKPVDMENVKTSTETVSFFLLLCFGEECL